jgi:hypothetical protein
VFNRIFAALAAKDGKTEQLMIGGTTSRLTDRGSLLDSLYGDVSAAPKAG